MKVFCDFLPIHIIILAIRFIIGGCFLIRNIIVEIILLRWPLRLTILVEFFIVDNAIHKFRAYLATTYVHNIQKSNIIKIYMQVFSLQNLVDILTAQSYLS